MELTSVLLVATGIIAFLLLLQGLAGPLRILFRLALNSLVGGLALWLLNQAGGAVGLHWGLNPLSVLVTGLLGVPGVIGLGIIGKLFG